MLGTCLSNRYEITAEIGRGGMGVVYRARDPRLDRDVAIKLIPPLRVGSGNEERFQREARVVAQMDHPAIVPIHDYGRHEGALFFVMPLLDGTTLRQLVKEDRLPLMNTVEVGTQVAEALDYSHSQGILHRDVKPENIMVRSERGNLRVRVMDFGLARDLGDSRITLTEGLMVGTPAYLSPEQILGKHLDPRSDIYSLGVVLYECLAGEPPFTGPLHTTIERIRKEPACPLSDRGLELDGELERIVLCCLAKRPSDRPASGRELAAALASYRRKLREGGRAGVVAVRGRQRRHSNTPPGTPLVGREEELETLLGSLEHAADGQCQLVLLAGEAGTGKTRLLEELEARVRQRPIRVLRGLFAESEGASPYQGLSDLILDYFRNAKRPDRTPDLGDLAAELLPLFPVLSEIEPLRRAALAYPPPAERPEAGEPVDDEATAPGSIRVFELLASTLSRLLDGRPALLLLENLHRGEISIDALAYMVRRLAPTPTVIVGSYRPSEVDRGHPFERFLDSFRDNPGCRTLHLKPLDRSSFHQLLEALIGTAALREDLVDSLFEATEGNPFFAQELVRTLNESGEIHRDESGGFMLAGETELPARALPATMQQAIEKRLERLPTGQQRLLATASVLGKQFEFRDLLALALDRHGAGIAATEADLEDDVDALVRQGLLVEDRKSRGDQLRFASGIVRNVLYSEIPRRRRRSLHRRLAEHLERRHTGRLDRVHASLVHHFYEGDVPEKTVVYALALAHNLLETWSPEDAIRACKKALEFAEEEEVEDARRVQAELHRLVAQAHSALGQSSSALLRADKALKAYREIGSLKDAAEVALFAARVAWQNRQVRETRRWVDRGVRYARQSDSREPLRLLLTLGATVANLRGDPTAADAFHREVQSLSDALEPVETMPPDGHLTSVLPASIGSLDPGVTHADWEVEVVAILFDTLLTCDASGRLAAALCTAWESLEDGRSFELTLREGVTFADGHPFTADEVKSALERAARCQGKNPAAALFELEGIEEYIRGTADEVQGIKVLGPGRLRFHLRQALPIFPALLTDSGTAIARAVEGGLVGTGPFRLAEEQPSDERIRLERNERGWRRPRPSLKRIDLRTDLDAAGIAVGLRQGEIDLARSLPPEVLEDVLRDPRFQSGLVETTKKNVYFALWNTSGPQSQRRELRQALGAVPVRDLVWRTLGRFAQPAVGLIPPGILGHDPGRRLHSITPEEAKQLLQALRLEFPISLRAAVLPLFADRYGDLVRSLFRHWRELGVEVSNLTPTMDSFVERLTDNAGIDLFLGRWNADYEDPDNFTHYLFHSAGGMFRTWFSSPESDQLLERARREVEPETRRELYHRFEELLAQEHIFLPLFHDVDYRIAGPTVRRLCLGSSPPYVDYASLSKVEETPAEDPPSPQLSGEIHVPVVGRLRSLDPLRTPVLEYAEVIPNVFETLTVINDDTRIVPRLARSFEALDGGLRYRFALRPQVLFHDGRRLSARDVRYSFERVLRQPRSDLPRLPIRGAIALCEGTATELEGFTLLSESEFLLELEEPLAFFPALLTHPAFAVVPEGCQVFAGRWRDGCVGTGPFRVVGFEAGERLDLERNPHYWRTGLPRSNRLVFHCGFVAEHIPIELEAGRLALASDLRPADVEKLRKIPEFAAGWHEAPRLSTYFLALNTRRGPFRDSGLRRAFAAAVDVRRSLAEPGLGRMAVPAYGLLPPGLLGYEPPSATPQPPLDAAEILRGVRLEAALNPAYAGSYAPLWQSLEHTFDRLGLQIQVSHGSASDMIDRARRGDFDFKAQRWIADYPDSDNFMMGLLHSEHGVLGRLCGSEEMDRRLEQGRREHDPALRHAIYRELEELLAREALLVPLFHEQTYRIAHPHTRGLRVGLSVPEVRYEELWTVG